MNIIEVRWDIWIFRVARSFWPKNRGDQNYQPKQCTIMREIPQNYHTFAYFDATKMDNLITPGKKKTVLPRSLFVLCPLGLCQNHGAILPIKSRRNPEILPETVVFQRFLTDSGSSLSFEHKCQRNTLLSTYNKHTNIPTVMVILLFKAWTT